MSLRYGYFDSEISGYDEEGMPIFDRHATSDFMAMFISKIISDGVLADPADCFQVIAGDGMNLIVRPGFGIIRGRFAAHQKFLHDHSAPNRNESFHREHSVRFSGSYLSSFWNHLYSLM